MSPKRPLLTPAEDLHAHALAAAPGSVIPEAREEVPCPLCGSESREAVMFARDRLFGAPDAYRIVRCTACDLRYLSPRPTLDALGAHYPDDYFIYKKIEDEPWPLRSALAWIDEHHWSRSLARIEKVLGPLTSSAEVVDVGCGMNQFLATLQRKRQCLGVGIDFKPEIAAYVRDVRKMPVVCGTLHDASFEAQRFDLVTMHEYLEHEPFPRSVLEEARRVTKPGGHIWIEVPNGESLPAKLFGSRWSQLDVPRHLCHFTPTTLTKLLEATGYRVVEVGSFQIPLMLGMSVLQALGRTRLGALAGVDGALVTLAGLPLLPASPWLREFTCVAAQAI